MFNTSLLNDFNNEILEAAIQKRQEEIVCYFYDLWQDVGDSIFENYFSYIFPPGFIERDKERAKQVILAIYDNVRSVIIRRYPKAIYCYVMHEMIEVWFDDPYTETIDMLPSEVAELIEKIKVLDDDALNRDGNNLSERISGWFTDKESCLDDFEDAYDEDFFDEITAEAAAELFLAKTESLDCLGIDIRELIDLLPTDLYDLVLEKLEANKTQVYKATDRFLKITWPEVEGFYHVLAHSGSLKVSSYKGAMEILLIFKDWVENNGGWKNIWSTEPSTRETAVQRLIVLGAKTYLKDQNLDMNCENNIGVGEEDIKISRGNDKTIIEIKLTSNRHCKQGFEKQLPRYAEAEHTDNMIFCLIDLGNSNTADEIRALRAAGKNREVPDLLVINASPQKAASVL